MQNKSYFRYVFVVLVYKNIKVLCEFFNSLKVGDSHVIVVNSFFDEISLGTCKEVAFAYKADFISIENRGFGYGNNVGTKYAIEHYEFDYLILSNSDIHVRSVDTLLRIHKDVAVIAPFTHLPNGKVQNPNLPWRNKMLFKLLKVSYDKNSKIFLSFAHIFTRFSRELFRVYQLFTRKLSYNIYSCHGSFIIMTKKAVEILYPIFDERMFLYNEELFLAEKCRIKGVPILFCPSLDVLHLEGASSSDGHGFELNKASFLILYEWMQSKGLL